MTPRGIEPSISRLKVWNPNLWTMGPKESGNRPTKQIKIHFIVEIQIEKNLGHFKPPSFPLQRIELRFAEPKSAVLPLDERGIFV